MKGTLAATGILLVHMAAAAPAIAAADDRLIDAVAKQDFATARSLIRGGANVNDARADGSTPLLWAAYWDQKELASDLIRRGAQPNAADDHGVTPLAAAAENRSAAMIAVLLEGGADPNKGQQSGLTPLMIAAKVGDLDSVRLLLKHGANVNARTTAKGSTALMWATTNQHDAVVRELIATGADISASTTTGFTPLMYAAGNGDLDIGGALIAAGADVNAPSGDGTHVLPFAILAGQMPFALFLLEKGADPNGSMNGVRALHVAAGSVDLWMANWYAVNGRRFSIGPRARRSPNMMEERLQVVKALLAKGADPNARITRSAMVMDYIGYPKKGAFEPFACGTGDLAGATPLWVAAYSTNGIIAHIGFDMNPSASSAAVVKALLDGGADQHLTTVDGTTPFMVAAGLGRATFTPGRKRGDPFPDQFAAVKVLFEAGAKLNAVNEADFTALHGAAYRGLNEIVEYLVQNGARIDARDFRGRTPYRLAEGSKQSFQFQAFPETAELLRKLGANVELGIAGSVQERVRDVEAGGQQ